jgi:hypothetical protein
VRLLSLFYLFSFDEIPSIVDQMIGHSLVTKQTGKDGVLVRKVPKVKKLSILSLNLICQVSTHLNSFFVTVMLKCHLGIDN